MVDLCGNSSAAATLDDYLVGKATIDSVVGENAGGFDVIVSRGDQSIDLIRPRTLLSEELRQGVEKCGTNEQPTIPSELTPGMTWDEVCDAAGFLRQS